MKNLSVSVIAETETMPVEETTTESGATPMLTTAPSEDGYYTREGSYIYFGSYPQSEVTDASLKTALTNQAGSTSTWTSYNYYIEGQISDFMVYKDVTYNGTKYRGVYFSRYRPCWTTGSSSSGNSFQEDNGYYTSTIYWFKYEPIKWKILEETNGEAFLCAELILDSQDYDGDDSSNNYANSCIRSWLNSTFYNTAFTATEKTKIKTTAVDNSVSSTGYSSNSYACGNTNDKIFLLSYKEVTNSAYGFSSGSSRVKKLTAYAKAQVAYSSSECGWWWLRSPCCDDSYIARAVYIDGDINNYIYVIDTNFGVVPALHLTL